MTRPARLLISLLLVLALPGWAGAVNHDFTARNGTQPVASGSFTFQGGGETKTVTTDGSGKAVVDLQPNTRYQIDQSAFVNGLFGYWGSSATFTTPSTPSQPIDFQVTPQRATDLWTPPPGVFTPSFVYQSRNVGDMKQTKDVRTDHVLNGNFNFVDRADASGLQQRNNDLTNGFNVQMGGVYIAAGLPVGPLGRCECMSFSHALGIGGGLNSLNLDVSSRSDQRGFATELSGSGGYFNADYTFVAMQKPTDRWYSNFGARFLGEYFTGGASVTRHPKGSDGLSSLNGRPTSEPTGDMNWSSWGVGLDVLYRPMMNLNVFAGVKYRETSLAVNTKDPSFVPGPNEVNRAIDQRYFSHNVLGRVGAEFVWPGLLGGKFPLLGRAEFEIGQSGDLGAMVKFGTGFDLFSNWRGGGSGETLGH